MPETPPSQQMRAVPERSGRWRRAPGASGSFGSGDPLARAIPRRARVSGWLAIVLALGFAALITPVITAERWLLRFEPGSVVERQPAPFTVRAPMLAGYDQLRVGGGVVVTRGELATAAEATTADAIATAMPRGPALYAALFLLSFVLAALFSLHMRRSNKGRLIRVQIVSLALIVVLAVVAKAVMLATALSALVVPVALLAIIPTLALDRVAGLGTGVLAALVVSLLAPFDVGLAILLLAQAATAGLVIAERPKRAWAPALLAGLITTLCTGAMYMLLTYLTTGHVPELRDPLHSPWLAALVGPGIAALVAVPLLPLYQLLVGEITHGQLIALADLDHPLLRQIANKAPGTWQHSLMMANMAEIAANAIGANGRLVRVGAYYHDLGKSLSPKYFIENLEAGETSPHDQLPPEISCDAIFAHVSEGIVAARKAGLHERIIDFMHMHHGNGVLEYFWARCREQGNPHGYTVEQFRYPGHPPQSRETAILTICDAVEAASRTLKKPDAASIDSLVQRIVYGKLHLGQLDESGLSMRDLRRISDSLRETIRHANHGRIEYPWQKAEQDASASAPPVTSTAPRLDSLDRAPARDSGARPVPSASRPDATRSTDALAATADLHEPGPGAAVRAPDRPDLARSPARRARTSSRAEVEASPAGAGAVVDEAAEDDTGRIVRRTAPAALSIVDTERAAPPARDAGATLPGRAPGPSRDDETGFAPTLRPGEEGDRAPTPADHASDAAGELAPPEPARASPRRSPGPPPASDLITPETFSEPAPEARTRAATLPPAPQPRPGTVPPPLVSRRIEQTGRIEQAARTEQTPRTEQARTEQTARTERPAPSRTAGPPEPVDLENAITNPPPLRHARGAPAVAQDPAQIAAALAEIVSRVRAAPFGGAAPEAPEAPDVDDNATTIPPPMLRAPRTTGLDRAPRSADTDLASPPPATTLSPAALASATHEAAAATIEDADSAATQPSLPVAPPVTEPRPASTTAHPRPSPAPAAPARRMSTASPVGELRPPAPVAELAPEDARVTVPRAVIDPHADDVRVTAPHQTAVPPDVDAGFDPSRRSGLAPHDPVTLDASVTEPTLPTLAVGDLRRLDVPVRTTPPSPPPRRKPGWSSGLAARIDAAIDSDEWGVETPVVAPTNAELRALTGNPDPTREQPVDELELLQRRAAELGVREARRAPNPTAEVDPDDIEAAIEVAPPARRPTHAHAIRAAKPKKTE